jgi:DNA polymerase-3 subunit gamma/tau
MPAIKQSAAGVETVADTVVEMPAPASRSKREVMPFPAAAVPAAGFAEVLTEGALAMAPEPTNGYLVPAGGAEPPNSEATELPDESQLREVVCSALASAGHVSASQLLGSGAWTLDNATLRIEVAGMGKKMLSLTVNAAAEKIIRQELQRLGASSRFLVVPGAANGAGPAPTLAPIAGSVHEEALKNPLVQRAKEIFNAEVRSVVDLRGQ